VPRGTGVGRKLGDVLGYHNVAFQVDDAEYCSVGGDVDTSIICCRCSDLNGAEEAQESDEDATERARLTMLASHPLRNLTQSLELAQRAPPNSAELCFVCGRFVAVLFF